MMNSISLKSNKWRVIGPGGGGGQFLPTISPHDPDTMLVACDMNGCYITSDKGCTWTQFNLRGRVDAYAFDPADACTLYAGSSGLFRSIDGGESWNLVFPDPAEVIEERMEGDEADHSFISRDNWPGGKIQAIMVDKTDNSRIYCGIHKNGTLRIFHSSDYGAQWTELLKTTGIKVHRLYLDPQSPPEDRELLVLTNTGAMSVRVKEKRIRVINLPDTIREIIHGALGVDPVSGLSLLYITARINEDKNKASIGMYKSQDNGLTWKELKAQPEGPPACTEGNRFPEYTLLAVPEADGRCIYAGVGGDITDGTGGYCEISEESASGSMISYFGIIKSTDGGNTWKWAFKSNYGSNPGNLRAGWAERDYDLSWYGTGPKGIGPIGLGVSPVNSEVCCFTDLSSTFLTRNGGTSWEQVYSNDRDRGAVSTRGMDVTTCYGVHFDPFDKEHIAISYTDIGLFHSRDGGNTWLHAIRHVPVTWGNTCYWLEFDPDVPGKVWSVWGGAHDLPRSKMFRSGRLHTFHGGVCKSLDGMDSWSQSNDGMPGNSVATHILLDNASPVGNRTLYTAVFDKGVYKSTDDGCNWSLKNNGIEGNLNAWRIIMLPDGTLYLLISRGMRNKKAVDGALYKSIDGAEHWEKLRLPEGVNAPNDLIFDPRDTKCMYMACWPEEGVINSKAGGIYATSDGGCTWVNIFDSSAHVYGIAAHPDNPSLLFAATFNSAAYRSEDKGETWKPLDGFDFKWGHRPVIDPNRKDMLYITTFGSSVWYGPAFDTSK